MEDIQALTKPSNIPPVSLEELNDYSEGNKDKWIKNHTYGTTITKASDFRPDRIYHLATKLENMFCATQTQITKFISGQLDEVTSGSSAPPVLTYRLRQS